MLVEQFHAFVAVPCGIVIAPCHYVADEVHVRILGEDRILKLLEALIVMVALKGRVGLVVLIANLEILDVVRLWMTVLSTQRSVLACDRTIGILQSVHTFVNPRLDAVHGSHATVPQTHVHHVERFGVKVFGKLQVFVKSHAVACAITPVDVLVSGTFFDGTDGLLPMESILWRLLSFHVATAGEAYELGTDVIEKLCKVGAQTVLAIHECRREEADNVQCDGALAVEDQLELSFRVVGVGCKRGSELAPLLSHLSVHGCLGIHALAVGADEASLNAALVASFSPKRQLVSSALHGIDAPETLVDERGSGVLTRSDVYLKSLALSVVEQSLADELRRDGCSVCSLCAPCGNGVVAVFERTVADKLGVEAAVRSMIDVLEEDAVEIRRHLNAGIGDINVYLHLGVCR